MYERTTKKTFVRKDVVAAGQFAERPKEVVSRTPRAIYKVGNQWAGKLFLRTKQH
jgi:hypothetical protein